MPEPTPIADLLDPGIYADKQIVMCVEGRLKSLFKVTKGNGQDGPYEFQNGILEDESGEIKVSFSNNTQPNSARGQLVRLTSFKTDNFGWQGVKVEDREYEGKEGWVNERQLKVTGVCEVEFPEGLSEQGGGRQQRPQNTQRQQPRQQPRQQQSNPRQQSREPQRPQNMAPQQQKPAGLPHPSVILDDLIELHFEVARRINEKYGEEKPEFVATVFIEAAKQGLVLNYKERAAKALKKTYPPAPSDPNQWRECVLASGDFEGKTLAEVPDDYLKKLFAAYDEKGANSHTAECVYKAAADRGLLRPPRPAADPDLDTAPDDIPF